MKLNSAQYASIMRDYDNKRKANRELLEARQQEIREKLPEYVELSKQASKLSMEATECTILGAQSHKLTELSKKLDEIKLAKKQLLVKNGYPEDYLSPIYSCSFCEDTGYIDGERCTCFTQASIDLLYNQSNVKKLLQRENFKNFNYQLYSDSFVDPGMKISSRMNIHTVVGDMESFIKSFPSGQNILLYGETGVGKTFLTHCIAAELLKAGHSVLYLTANELFDIFSQYSFNSWDDVDKREAFSQILDSELLIIDDLGTELANAFTNSKLFYCISERALNGTSTIISSNLDLEGIMNNYSERIFSRLTQSYSIYKIFGEDLRLVRS